MSSQNTQAQGRPLGAVDSQVSGVNPTSNIQRTQERWSGSSHQSQVSGRPIHGIQNSRNQQQRRLNGVLNNRSISSLPNQQQQQHRRGFASMGQQIVGRSLSIQFSREQQQHNNYSPTLLSILKEEQIYRSLIHFYDLIYHILILIGFAFVVCCVCNQLLSIEFLFLYAYIYDAMNLVRTVFRGYVYSHKKARQKNILVVFEVISLMIAKGILFVHLSFPEKLRSIYSVVPIIVYFLLRFILFRIEKNVEDLNSMINFFLLGYRIFWVLLSISICLKLDQTVDWGWYQTVWSFWIIFSVFVGMAFGSFLVMLSKLFQLCLNEASSFEFTGLAWIFLNIAGATAGICLFVFGVVNYLDSSDTELIQIFQRFLIIYFVAYCMITFFFKKSIIEYFKHIASFDLEYIRTLHMGSIASEMERIKVSNQQQLEGAVENNNPLSERNELQSEEKKDNTKSEGKKQDQLIIPRFLEKFSNTFFRKPDPKMNPKEYSKQIEDKKAEKALKKAQKLQQKQKIVEKNNQSNQVNNQNIKEPIKQNREKKLQNHARSVSSIQIEQNSQTSAQQFTRGELIPQNHGQNFASDLISSLKKGANSLIRPFKKNSMKLNLDSVENQREIIIQHTDFETLESEDRQRVLIEFSDDLDEASQQAQNNNNLKKHHISIINNNTEIKLEDQNALQYQKRIDQILKPIAEEQSILDQTRDFPKIMTKRQDDQTEQNQFIHQDFQKHRRFLSIQPQNKITNNLNEIPQLLVKNNNQEKSKSNIESQKWIDNNIDIRDTDKSDISNNQSKIFGQDQSSILSSSQIDKSVITCLICFDKSPDSVFMDCGHGGVCYECSLEIWKKTGECYLCRLKIVQVLQVDMLSKANGLIKVISATQMIQKETDVSIPSISNRQDHPGLQEILEEEGQD